MSIPGILTAAVFLMLWQQPEGLRLEVAPPPPKTPDSPDMGVVVFEIQPSTDGSVADKKLLRGEPPFVEPAWLAIEEWTFRGVNTSRPGLSAAFVFRPKLTLPDSPAIVEYPIPDAPFNEIYSAVPVKIVDPGYPVGGVGSGVVVLQLRLKDSGDVEAVDVVTRVPTLTRPAIRAVCQWKFFVPPTAQPWARFAIAVISFQEPALASTLSPEILELNEPLNVSCSSAAHP